MLGGKGDGGVDNFFNGQADRWKGGQAGGED